jgi:hypothetical protein
MARSVGAPQVQSITTSTSAAASPSLAALCTGEDAEEWARYEMPAAEFLYRILTDPRFLPYSVAQSVPEPFFEPCLNAR